MYNYDPVKYYRGSVHGGKEHLRKRPILERNQEGLPEEMTFELTSEERVGVNWMIAGGRAFQARTVPAKALGSRAGDHGSLKELEGECD